MEIQPVEKKRVYQSIIEQFVDMIRQGKLKAGDKLPAERELSQMFQVSRPSLREALRVMETIGLVEIRPGGGSRVTDLNILPFINIISPLFLQREEFGIEILELRFMLEVKAADLAANNHREDKERLLSPCIQKMKDAVEKNDPELGGQADVEFHKALFSLSNNYVLAMAGEFVTSVLEISVPFARQIVLKDPSNSLTLLHQHQNIYEAVVKGDSGKARQLMEDHLKLVLDFYISK